MTRTEWIEKCQHWKNKWPVIQDEYLQDTGHGLNLYAVLDAVNKYSRADQVLMGDAGSISYVGPVALNPKPGQRLVFSPAQADMGWALPAAIGVALDNHSVISIIGDGSFMSNLQELAVATQHDLDIAFVILNNNGYLSIKNTQQKYFEGRVYGTSGETGLWFPKFKDIADSFNISYHEFAKVDELAKFEQVLNQKGPRIINCICTPDQEILPSQALKNGRQAGLHDMAPFLSDDEMQQEIVNRDLLNL